MKTSFSFWPATILLVALTISCKKAAEKAHEKVLETAIESSSGGNADVDIDKNNISIESDEGSLKINSGENTWPENMPGLVAQPSGGTISGVVTAETDEGNTWSVQYTGIPLSELEKYRDDLKSKGFKTTIMKSDAGGMVSGEKDKLTITLSLSTDQGALLVVQGK